MDVNDETLVLLGSKKQNTGQPRLSELRKLLRKGVPRSAAIKMLERTPAAVRGPWRALILTGPERATLNPESSERAARLAQVLALAHEVWGSWPEANRFLTKPHRQLDNESPYDAAKSEFGARQVEQVLRNIQFGLPA